MVLTALQQCQDATYIALSDRGHIQGRFWLLRRRAGTACTRGTAPKPRITWASWRGAFRSYPRYCARKLQAGAEARGRRTVTAVPLPSWLSKVTLPPCCSTIWRAPVSPIPVPATCPATFLPRWNRSKRCGAGPRRECPARGR
jgi:hypothetical protein